MIWVNQMEDMINMKICPYCREASLNSMKKITTNSTKGFNCKHCGSRVTITPQSRWKYFALYFQSIIAIGLFSGLFKYIALGIIITVNIIDSMFRCQFIKFEEGSKKI